MSQTPIHSAPLTRRRFLTLSSASVVAVAATPAWSSALLTSSERKLSFVHTHTAETLSLTYFKDGGYVNGALTRLNHLLRDFRNEASHPIDPALFDILYDLQVRANRDATYEIISGYRSPATNQMLHERSSGVATHSMHMEGRAIDVRLTGFSCKKLQELALSAQRGGVGYYGASNFVHLDTGRVRRW